MRFRTTLARLGWALASCCCGPALAGNLIVGETTVSQGAPTAVVAFFLERGPDEDVAALQLDVVYDASVLQVAELALGDAAANAGKQINSAPVAPGVERVLIAGANQAAITRGELFLVAFSIARGAEPGAYPVALGAMNVSDPFGVALPFGAAAGGVIIEAGETAPPPASDEPSDLEPEGEFVAEAAAEGEAPVNTGGVANTGDENRGGVADLDIPLNGVGSNDDGRLTERTGEPEPDPNAGPASQRQRAGGTAVHVSPSGQPVHYSSRQGPSPVRRPHTVSSRPSRRPTASQQHEPAAPASRYRSPAPEHRASGPSSSRDDHPHAHPANTTGRNYAMLETGRTHRPVPERRGRFDHATVVAETGPAQPLWLRALPWMLGVAFAACLLAGLWAVRSRFLDRPVRVRNGIERRVS